jgi:hypothetical protein
MNLSLYLLTVLIWGTTWIAIKLQIGAVAPSRLHYLSLRGGGAGAVCRAAAQWPLAASG